MQLKNCNLVEQKLYCCHVFQVVVVGVEGLKSVTANKIIYCTIEVEGEGKLQSEHMEASKAV